ncbi:hypothetical protein MSAN_00665700 [Mycena sanguinolenta]|uniref:Uncharacterized protein n=1 Tax=Mycena sanguinolenta TaxID=230812 RepID=A0A8H6Z180_9AGAR|nr:hypothetical protein MSAN_00665700 [Mycena sanguinolenta]
MSDSETISLSLQSPLFWHALTIALPLIPTVDLRYGGIGIVVVHLGVYVAHRIRPSSRIDQLNNEIKMAEELLSSAGFPEYPRIIFEVDEICCKLLQERLFVSQIQSDLLEEHHSSWIIHLQKMRAIWEKLNQCEHRILTLRTKTLLIIELDNRRKLAEDIKKSRETSAALHSAGITWYSQRSHDLESNQEVV